MKGNILVINSGSTSLKYKVFTQRRGAAASLRELDSGYIENIGSKGQVKDHEQAFKSVLGSIDDLESIQAVGHRVVHGGEEFIKPTVINKQNLRRLEKYNKLAPLHNPANIQGIKACFKLLPGTINIAVFDTSFYQSLPEEAYRYALPEKYYKKYGIRRYGFHGISHQYVVNQAQGRGKKLKAISCHLGGGCSVTASKGGRAIDTSMGFTPLEGLMMMSRSGDLDPGVVTFLQREAGLSTKAVDELLNYQSGVLGVAGEKDWLKLLQKMRQGNKKAKLAFDMFCYRVKKYIGAYQAVLGGLDTLIFTGAVGSGDPATRRRICAGLPFLKGVKVVAVETNEELAIVKEVAKLV